jgi:hypothetical protein
VHGRLEVSEGIDLLNRGEGKGRLEETTATHRTTVDSWLGEPFRDALLAEVMLAWQANWSFHRIVAYRAVRAPQAPQAPQAPERWRGSPPGLGEPSLLCVDRRVG